MKTKKFFAFLLAFVCILGLVACKTTEPTTAGPEKQSVSAVLANPQNNVEVLVEGAVFAVAPHGYYISDETSGIYVNLGSSATPTVTVGQKIEVKAKLSYVSKFPSLVSVTNEEIVGTTSEIEPQEATIVEINALDKNAVASYAKYFKVVGTLTKDESGTYYMSDDEGNKLYFDSATSNIQYLEEKKTFRVELPVVTYKNTTQWTVSFCGSQNNIVDRTRTIADYQSIIEEDLEKRMVTEVYGTLNLPTGHNVLTFLQYVWSVKEAESVVDIKNNNATITLDFDKDNEATLVCTFQVGTETGKVEVPITCKQIATQSVKQLLDNQPVVNLSYVKVNGIVTALTHNQSKSLYSVVIQDKDEPASNGVFFDVKDFNAQQLFAVGDEVTVLGKYRNVSSKDRPCIQALSDEAGLFIGYEIISHNNTVSMAEALVVDSEAKYNELASNYFDYIGRIVKFVNPYAAMNKALSTSTYIDLGHDENTKQYLMGDGKSTLTFGIVCMGNSDENFGSDLWHKYFEIDTTNKESGMVIYAIPGYYDANGHSQLMIVNSASVKPYDETKVVDFALECTVIRGAKADFELPAKVGEIDLIWSSSDPTVVSDAGIVQGLQTEEKEVTLTASYKLSQEGETLTKAIKVTVLVEKIYTVSEMAAKEATTVEYNFQGEIVGFASQHGGSYRGNGILVSDGANVLLIGTYPCLTFPAKEDVAGRNTYKYNEKEIKVGDVIAFSHATVIEEGLTLALSTESQLEWLEEGKITTTSFDYPVIDSKEDLGAYMASVTAASGKTASSRIVKLVGTTESPIYFGAMNGYGMAIYYLGESDTTAAAMSYPVGYTTSKTPYMIMVPTVVAATLGENWLAENTPYSIDFTQSYGAQYTKTTDATLKLYGFTGEIILVLEYTGTASYPYIYMNPVSAGCTLEIIPTKAYAESRIAAGIPEEIGSKTSDLSDFTLLTAGKLFSEITYASNNAAINFETGAVAHGDEEVEVTITVTYKLVGSDTEETYTQKVTVSPDGTPTYQLITKAADLVAGDKVVFVVKSGDKYYALSDDYSTGVEVTLDKDGYLVVVPTVGYINVIQSTTSGYESAFAFKKSNGQHLVAGGSGKDHTTIGWQNSCSANTSYVLEIQSGSTNIDVQGTNVNCYIEYDVDTNKFQRTATFGNLMIFKFVLVK